MLSLMQRVLIAFLILTIAAASPAVIDSSVDRAMRELHVPGVAIGIIQDGKVILAKGYGVRQLGQSAPVTPDTIVAVGSMTKSFTAVTMAAMVDEKKLDWE